jgi:hypothetical protein
MKSPMLFSAQKVKKLFEMHKNTLTKTGKREKTK